MANPALDAISSIMNIFREEDIDLEDKLRDL